MYCTSYIMVQILSSVLCCMILQYKHFLFQDLLCGLMFVCFCFSVLFNATAVMVTAGEAVRVNCSQTGYIRGQWRWSRNGVNITTAPSVRVYSEMSARSKVGVSTGSTVDNHQSLFLHLRYARVMDNGEYTCVTETDTQTVTVDVQPPGGASINHMTANHTRTSYHIRAYNHIRCMQHMLLIHLCSLCRQCQVQ